MEKTTVKAKHPRAVRERVKWLVMLLALFLSFVWIGSQVSTCSEGKAATKSNTVSKDVIAANLNYGLARRQSLGFFDDISAEHWKIIKAISNARVHHLKKLSGYDKFYAENWDPDFSCQFEDSIGQNESDGHKWVCDPHRLRNKKDCLIYSFGCNGQFEFEVDMQRVVPNCEIHIFDPKDYQQKMWDVGLNGKNYHAWGLRPATEFDPSTLPDDVKLLTFRTLNETMELLGHLGRRVDVFKIDCEGCEWKNYPEFLDHDLRQILVEVHGWNDPKLFDSMAEAGYVIFHKEPNLFTNGQGIEFAFLKLAKEFFL